jgi:Phosphodiester glycosidase
VSGALAALALAGTLASCSTTPTAHGAASHPGGGAANTTSTTRAPTTTTTTAPPGPRPLPAPAALTPFAPPPNPSDGTWTPAGRTVNGFPAVYETRLVPPGGSAEAGIAWMDTNLLGAQLYSGSKSPGGGPYMFTAPIQPAQAASLVAAFNGGFLMKDAQGGYFTEGRTIYPLVTGAASLVIHADGSVAVGAWGTDVSMAPDVVAVRQNLVPLVEAGQPTAQASNPNWGVWGATCGVSSCSGPGIENQWRSGVGVTADGALVYVVGPSLDPLQLAQLLVQAGVVRGMELDINPSWPDFATYSPPAGAPAGPSNGTSMPPAADQGPATFFEAAWARDFVTMSARTTAVGASNG